MSTWKRQFHRCCVSVRWWPKRPTTDPKLVTPKAHSDSFFKRIIWSILAGKLSSALTVAPIIITADVVHFARNSTFSAGFSKNEKKRHKTWQTHTPTHTNIMTRCTWVWAQLSLETMGHHHPHQSPHVQHFCLLSPWMSKQVKGECDKKKERKIPSSVHFFNGSINTQKNKLQLFKIQAKRSTGILKR